jgi:hypothetical protein
MWHRFFGSLPCLQLLKTFFGFGNEFTQPAFSLWLFDVTQNGSEPQNAVA